MAFGLALAVRVCGSNRSPGVGPIMLRLCTRALPTPVGRINKSKSHEEFKRTMEITTYRLKVTFTEPILGTQPQKDVATEFTQDKARAKGIPVEDEEETLPEMLEKGTTAFHRLDGQPIYYDYHVKGFLKEAGLVLNGTHGVRALRSKIDNLVFVLPRRILLQVPPDGPTNFIERPLRGMTLQGPRVSLARSETLPVGTSFACTLQVLAGPVSEAVLIELLDYGRFKGFGQWRNGGYGRFTYELTRD